MSKSFTFFCIIIALVFAFGAYALASCPLSFFSGAGVTFCIIGGITYIGLALMFSKDVSTGIR